VRADGELAPRNRLTDPAGQSADVERVEAGTAGGPGRRLRPLLRRPKPEASDIQARVRFSTEPTLNEVANKLEELAIQLRFSTEPATRLEIARVLVHLAGHTYGLAEVPLGQAPNNLSMPAVELPRD
jgi:hypothetical protein